MRRQEIGRYEIDATSGEAVRAFVPAPLPPVPPLDMGGRLQQLLEAATLALGRQDGNGRVGRLLITLLLCQAGALSEPLLYLSLYFKQNRREYYDLLNHTRITGDWEEWIEFFLEGVHTTADGAVNTSQRINQMFTADRELIQNVGRRSGSALRVHEALKEKPLRSIQEVANNTSLSFATVASAMEILAKLGISREITGRRRDRLFVYDEYLNILNEGTKAI